MKIATPNHEKRNNLHYRYITRLLFQIQSSIPRIVVTSNTAQETTNAYYMTKRLLLPSLYLKYKEQHKTFNSSSSGWWCGTTHVLFCLLFVIMMMRFRTIGMCRKRCVRWLPRNFGVFFVHGVAWSPWDSAFSQTLQLPHTCDVAMTFSTPMRRMGLTPCSAITCWLGCKQWSWISACTLCKCSGWHSDAWNLVPCASQAKQKSQQFQRDEIQAAWACCLGVFVVPDHSTNERICFDMPEQGNKAVRKPDEVALIAHKWWHQIRSKATNDLLRPMTKVSKFVGHHQRQSTKNSWFSKMIWQYSSGQK